LGLTWPWCSPGQRKNIDKRKKETLAFYEELAGAATADNGQGAQAGVQGIEGLVEAAFMTYLEGHKMVIKATDREEILRFMKEAYEHYSLGMPRPNQLNALIKVNVLNAVARNATLIGLPTERLCADDAISPFSQPGPLPLPDQATWPDPLRPSAVQRSVLHHPWIDLIPFPMMRDRAIRAFHSGVLDEDELCLDLMEVSTSRASDTPFLIVWGDSSDPRSWEATSPFLEKYGWLIWGCSEIFESTNMWRARRGEKLLSY
jgi:hypothetical protein